MRITYNQLLKLIKAFKDDPERLRQSLKHVFSFKENIDTFSYYFFPTACTCKIPDFHYEIHDWFFEPEDGALAAPRGHAKSTLVGLILIMFSIINKLEKYIVYTSQSYSKTVQFIEPLMNEFLDNKRLQFVYGVMTPGREVDDRGKFREDIIDVNGIRVQAASFEKNVRGFKYKNQRPTLVVLDDIEEDERVLNPELRLKDSYKLNKIIIPSLDPVEGRIKMIGTILHWDSLLVKKIRMYHGKIYRACDENFENVLWPQYWSKERLKVKRNSIGSVSFSSEFLNNPIENEASLIKALWIEKAKNDTISYGDKLIGTTKKLGCDFAFSDRAVADKSAYVGVVLHEGKKRLTDLITYKGLTIIEQFNYLQGLYKERGYDEVVMEENSLKSLSRDLYKYDFKYYLIWTAGSDPADKLKTQPEFIGKRHSVGKQQMIMRLATCFENGEIELPYKTEHDRQLTNQLKDELLTFALDAGKLVEVGVHADIPVALAMALERMQTKTTVLSL